MSQYDELTKTQYKDILDGERRIRGWNDAVEVLGLIGDELFKRGDTKDMQKRGHAILKALNVVAPRLESWLPTVYTNFNKCDLE